MPGVRGLQVWVKDTFDCNGNKLDVKRLGTNANIHWASDMTTQIIDGVDYMAVSYTHLDVYKRQVNKRLTKCKLSKNSICEVRVKKKEKWGKRTWRT